MNYSEEYIREKGYTNYVNVTEKISKKSWNIPIPAPPTKLLDTPYVLYQFHYRVIRKILFTWLFTQTVFHNALNRKKCIYRITIRKIVRTTYKLLHTFPKSELLTKQPNYKVKHVICTLTIRDHFDWNEALQIKRYWSPICRPAMKFAFEFNACQEFPKVNIPLCSPDDMLKLLNERRFKERSMLLRFDLEMNKDKYKKDLFSEEDFCFWSKYRFEKLKAMGKISDMVKSLVPCHCKCSCGYCHLRNCKLYRDEYQFPARCYRRRRINPKKRNLVGRKWKIYKRNNLPKTKVGRKFRQEKARVWKQFLWKLYLLHPGPLLCEKRDWLFEGY